MIKKMLFSVLICFCFVNMQCSDNDDITNLDCDFTVTINNEKYDSLEPRDFKLSNAEINEYIN